MAAVLSLAVPMLLDLLCFGRWIDRQTEIENKMSLAEENMKKKYALFQMAVCPNSHSIILCGDNEYIEKREMVGVICRRFLYFISKDPPEKNAKNDSPSWKRRSRLPEPHSKKHQRNCSLWQYDSDAC